MVITPSLCMKDLGKAIRFNERLAYLEEFSNQFRLGKKSDFPISAGVCLNFTFLLRAEVAFSSQRGKFCVSSITFG